MEFKLNFPVLFISNLAFLFSITNGYKLSPINDTVPVKQRSALIYYLRSCDGYDPYSECESSKYNMKCQNKMCNCITGYEWSYDSYKCMKKCSDSSSCDNFNRYCNLGKCVCKDGYEESEYNDICQKKTGCSYCGSFMECVNDICICESGYSLSSSRTYCTFDYDYSTSWVYYLWLLILIPIIIIVVIVWCVCRRRVTSPGAVIIGSNTFIGQPNGQPHQYPAPPPPYSESNTYRY